MTLRPTAHYRSGPTISSFSTMFSLRSVNVKFLPMHDIQAYEFVDLRLWSWQLFFNLRAFWTWMARFRLLPTCLWERGPDVIWSRVQVSLGGALHVWRKGSSCLSLEPKHDFSLLQLVTYGWAVLVRISFQPDELYFSLLKLCENSTQANIHYEIVWRSSFFIIPVQRTY